MRILYAALRWDYGKPEQGDSFEHQTFYETLASLGHELIYFDFHSLLQDHDRDWVNRRLWDVAKNEGPNLLFSVLFGDELDPTVLRRISNETDTVTLNWFCDDHWRFHDYSRLWTPEFNWVVTTAPADVAPYEAFGLSNVIRSQWGCNTRIYHKPPGSDLLDERSVDGFKYDVSFVGMAHGNRPEIIARLGRAGILVNCWGAGWPNGRLTVRQMVDVFYRSRINLNFSNASVTVAQAEGAPARASRVNAALRRYPAAQRVAEAARRYIRSAPPSRDQQYVQQLKARTFEVPGSGGLLLTQNAPRLDDYFTIGEEVEVFHTFDELVEKIRSLLANESYRTAVAEAGYQRVLRDHTYEMRFNAIFSQIGLAGANPR